MPFSTKAGTCATVAQFWTASAPGTVSEPTVFAAFDPAWRGCSVLDLLMPRMNGQERLRKMGANMPIVFISGSSDISAAVQAIRDGASDFLQKPYPQQQLMDAINKALGDIGT